MTEQDLLNLAEAIRVLQESPIIDGLVVIPWEKATIEPGQDMCLTPEDRDEVLADLQAQLKRLLCQ
jgi:hypothetical protein